RATPGPRLSLHPLPCESCVGRAAPFSPKPFSSPMGVQRKPPRRSDGISAAARKIWPTSRYRSGVIAFFSAQLPQKPGPSEAPITLYCSLRHFEHFSNFRFDQSAKETQFANLALPFVKLR